MEIHQLRYVVAVAETGNFTRASERVHISQPSLSQQIINLENEVGRKLFHRLGRKAVLTEAGEVFLERARRILFEIENAAKELGDHPTLERRIVVGAIPTVAPYILPELITRCRARYPNLQIDVREDFRIHLTRAAIEGEVDLAIVALPIKDPRLSVESLLTEPLLLVVGKDHPLAHKPRVKAADLAGESPATPRTLNRSSTSSFRAVRPPASWPSSAINNVIKAAAPNNFSRCYASGPPSS